MKFKSGRGGARAGAGAKKGARLSDGERRQRFQVRLPGTLIEWLRQEQGSAGRIVEAAILAAHGDEINRFKNEKGV